MTNQNSVTLSASVQRFTSRVALGMVWRLPVALALALAITACGPGTGGTGVGPTSSIYLSGSSGTASPSGGGTGAGTVTGAASVTAASGGFALTLDPLAIRLAGACLNFSFDGAWVESSGEIRVTGSYRLAAPASDLAQAPLQAGSLIARAEGPGYNVTLLDARGALLLGFTTGAKVADGMAVAPLPACKSLPPASVP